MLRRILVVSSLAILASCSQGLMADGSSEVALNQSLEVMYKHLPEAQRARLKDDIAWLNSRVQRKVYKGGSAEDANREYLELLDGKTAPEIDALVQELRPAIQAQP